jgi:hypothetical protein
VELWLLSDKGAHEIVDLLCHEPEVTSLGNDGVFLLDVKTGCVMLGVSLGRVLLQGMQLDGPQDLADLLKVGSIALDESFDNIFNADDGRVGGFAEQFFNQIVVSDRHPLVLLLQAATLANEIIHDGLCGVAEGNVVLDLHEAPDNI